jgi:hypothetical protein
MATDFLHPSYASRMKPAPQAGTVEPTLPAFATGYRHVLLEADRACCCSARPAVIAILPPVPTRRHRTELLLCMHHYRAAKRGLAAAAAIVADASGRVLSRQEEAPFAASY